jgi:hypothetical protein
VAEFAFLFRAPAGGNIESQTQQTMQKWAAWLKGLGEQGLITNPGQPLAAGGKLVVGRSKVINDAPLAELKDVVNGFIVIQAKDISEAVEVSKGCPILEADGTVEIRPVKAINIR